MSVANELLNAPLPAMITNLGRGIAEAQRALDDQALRLALLLGDKEDHGVEIAGETRSLLELGFTPTFYQFTETTIETRVAFSMATSTEVSASVSATVGGAYYFVMFAASMSASYTNKYSFESSGSSAVTTKIKAIPAPSILQTLLAQQAKEDT